MGSQYLLVYLSFCLILSNFYEVHCRLKLYNPVHCFSNNITYDNFKVDFYFSSKNEYRRELTDEVISSGNFDFDPKRTTVVTIHGLSPQLYPNKIEELRDAFLEWGDINLIEVDWRRGCSNAITYVKAVVNTENAAIKVSQLFGRLIKTWDGTEKSVENWSRLHVVGHSLGAHTAGQSAERLKNEHGLTVDWVTALDPAGPCFHIDSRLRLKKSDASFVDVIHTDGGTDSKLQLGTLEPLGHIDFYVNGGRSQPGCPTLRFKRETINLLQLGYHMINENALCQHLRAYSLYSDTLRQAKKGECTFWALPWDAKKIQGNKEPAGLKSCNKRKCIEMGVNVENYRNARGVYYARTSSASPFCNY